MPKDQFGRRIRMIGSPQTRTMMTPRRARQLKLSAAAAAALAIGLAVIAATVK